MKVGAISFPGFSQSPFFADAFLEAALLKSWPGGVALVGGLLTAGAWAVRGRSSQVFGPSVHRIPKHKLSSSPRIALTFDDGPSESTPELLELLARHRAKATFFLCGSNVCRLPAIARQITGSGHEIGNHSDTHPHFWLRGPDFIHDEFSRAQESIALIAGQVPVLVRAPFGVRWFGFRSMQQRLKLLHVMWTIIGRDWVLPAKAIERRILSGTVAPRSLTQNERQNQPIHMDPLNGAIICLHDGRELQTRPDVRPMLTALAAVLPVLRDRGFEFATVSQLLAGGSTREGRIHP